MDRMLAWTLGLAVAYGSVRIEDSTGCFDEYSVELDVREAVGDSAAENMEFVVQLTGTESWQLALTVSNASGTIWNRIVPVEPVDCPYLNELVAQSFVRGLADLPAWGLRYERRWPDLSLALSGTLPDVLRVGISGELWIPIGSRYGWQVQLTYLHSAVETIVLAADTVQVAYVVLQLETGPTFELGPLRAATRLAPGAARATGLDFTDGNLRSVKPRVTWTTELVWMPNDYLRLGPRLEVVLARARYGTLSGETLALELPVRGGLVVQLGGPIPRKRPNGDGSRPDGR